MDFETDAETRLAVIESKLDRIIHVLDDNGQPGIVTRLARLEGQVDYRVKIGGAAGALGGLAGALLTLIAKAAGFEL